MQPEGCGPSEFSHVWALVLTSFGVAFAFVFLHHGSSRDFFGSFAVTTGLTRRRKNVFVLALFLAAHAAQMFFSRHKIIPRLIMEYKCNRCRRRIRGSNIPFRLA